MRGDVGESWPDSPLLSSPLLASPLLSSPRLASHLLSSPRKLWALVVAMPPERAAGPFLTALFRTRHIEDAPIAARRHALGLLAGVCQVGVSFVA